MNITRGPIKTAKKVGIYGPEGVGKTTFASRFPGAVFIDTEGSTTTLQCQVVIQRIGCDEHMRYSISHGEEQTTDYRIGID